MIHCLLSLKIPDYIKFLFFGETTIKCYTIVKLTWIIHIRQFGSFKTKGRTEIIPTIVHAHTGKSSYRTQPSSEDPVYLGKIKIRL